MAVVLTPAGASGTGTHRSVGRGTNQQACASSEALCAPLACGGSVEMDHGRERAHHVLTG